MSDDVKERPILFSAPMIRAVLEGRKTVTRRVLKPQPVSSQLWGSGVPNSLPSHFCVHARWAEPYPPALKAFDAGDPWLPCPYGKPGDRLWVREAFGYYNTGRYDRPEMGVFYRATDNGGLVKRWRPSIHMPRALSRLTLQIVSIRVERLQTISSADCQAEGLSHNNDGDSIRRQFRNLWDGINGKRSNCAWNDNPWVFVVEFRKLEQP